MRKHFFYKIKFIITLFFLACFISCGGGGGKYYPPKIVLNKIGIVKEEINPQQIEINNKLILENDSQLEKEPEKYISGVKYYYFYKFRFMEKEYKIGIPIKNWVSIIDSDNKIIKNLETPRYTRNAAAIELSGKNNQRLLAVYIDQQATSHSSTLFILSHNWEVLYQEHLLGAQWMSKETSPKGDNLIIAAENMWRPKSEWMKVGGPWRYIIFQ